MQNLKNNFLKGIGIGTILLSILVILLMVSLVLPNITDLFWGKSIIKNHQAQVIGNETNATIIANKFLAWEYINVDAPYSYKKSIEWLPLPIYSINNKTTYFIRSNLASWIIISKLGNCGEHSYYFVEMMNESGFRSRLIMARGEDHVFAEYYDKEGTKVVVDPSGNMTINNTLERGSQTKWSRVVAVDLSGKEEDITKEYLNKTSELTIVANTSNSLTNRITITINSVLLESNSNKMYTQPIEVITHELDNNTFSIDLGSKKEYQIVMSIDFVILKFEKREDLDLTTNKNIIVTQGDLIKWKNIRFTYIDNFLFIILLIVIWIYYNYKSSKNKEDKVRG